MANTFKNRVLSNINSSSQEYLADGVTATVIGMTVANVDTTNVTVDVYVLDQSTSTTAYIVKQAVIPVGGNLVVIGGDQKVVLEPSDRIYIQTSASGEVVDAVISVMEIS